MGIAKRTKAELARDLVFVLNSNLHILTKKAVFKNASWAWTVLEGKYEGCLNWSIEARKLEYAKNVSRAERRGRRLIHDHAVPRKVVFELLLKMDRPAADIVQICCEKFLHGVVITPEEDRLLNRNRLRQKMPLQFFDKSHHDFENPWLRYQTCGIILDID